ncbi:MAG TPA: hypothetical protein VGX71_00460 [Pseudaminobacter sp.]|jgi:hypothetical protein|nr:hypothetical protein [Pseudaminobacter sp.]
MANGPVIKFPDGSAVEIVDPDNTVPAYVDLITEFREVDGVIYLSLGSFIIDGDEGGKKVRVIARLRLSKSRAASLYGLLGNMLGGPQDEAAKGAMN